jgi:hypothetical protein
VTVRDELTNYFLVAERLLSFSVPMTAERSDARTWPGEVLEELFADAFPAFITADAEAKKYVGRVREWFADLDIMLVDDDDVPVATGWGVPVAWNGELADLPAGYTDTIRRAVRGRERGQAADTFVICGGIVSRSRTGQGLAGELITALRDLARGRAARGSSHRCDRPSSRPIP